MWLQIQFYKAVLSNLHGPSYQDCKKKKKIIKLYNF